MEFKKLKIGEWFEEPRDSRKRIYIRVANGIDKDRGVIIKGEGQGYFMPFLPSDKVEIVHPDTCPLPKEPKK